MEKTNLTEIKCPIKCAIKCIQKMSNLQVLHRQVEEQLK